MNFVKFKWLYFLISGIFLVSGIISLIFWGLKPAVDFTGGTLLELKFQPDTKILRYEDIKSFFEEKEIELSSMQASGEETFLFRMEPVEKEKIEEIKSRLKEEFGEVEEARLETVGPILGKELLTKTLTAVVLAAGFILFYVARSFGDKKFGICAILAMFHDTLILLGIFSLLGHFKGVEVDTLFVTAVLTILSLSVHDTVVVFGRLRESLKKYPGVAINNLANKAIAETLARSINNSMTIIFMLLSLWLLGGETTRWFVFALLIGTISGTYSSTFTAVPLFVAWKNWEERRKA